MVPLIISRRRIYVAIGHEGSPLRESVLLLLLLLWLVLDGLPTLLVGRSRHHYRTSSRP
jgi:hypothetical protein